jgi:cytochrome P450
MRSDIPQTDTDDGEGCDLLGFFPDRSRCSSVGTHAETTENSAYFPFGAGPRLCIGERFTWLEGILILTTICHSWRLEDVEPAVDLQAKTTLQPVGGMKMRVVARAPFAG